MQDMALIASHSLQERQTTLGRCLAFGIVFRLLSLISMTFPALVHSQEINIEFPTRDTSKRTTPYVPTNYGERLDTKLNRAGCGVAEPVGRIVHGEPVKRRQQVPWIVKLAIYLPGWLYNCGGSIISSNVILTAAHCVVKPGGHDAPIEKVVVYYNTTIDAKGDSTQVESMISHPKYDRTSLYDMALLKLQEPLKFDAFVKPVCVPMHKIPVQGKPLLAAGWGMTGIGKELSKKLLYVQISALQDPLCEHILRQAKVDGVPVVIGPAICTNESKSTCKGDSGGPLTLQGGDGKALLVGVTSVGNNCTAEEELIGIYSRVSGYLPWLKKALSHPQEWRLIHKDDKISLE